MACAPSTRCAVRWIFHGRGIVSLTGSVGSSKGCPSPRGSRAFPGSCLPDTPRLQASDEPALQIETHRRIKHAAVDEVPYAVPFGDEPFAAKDAQRFPHRSPAYAQQAAQLFLGRKPAIRAALRTGQFENSLFHFHIQGSRCSLTRLTSDDFSITHPMWPVNVFPLRKIRRKADISSSRFCGKGCHAIPRGSSCARYVSKATKEMASGLPPVVPSGICRFVRLFSKDGVPLF